MIRINLLTVERQRTKKRVSGGLTFGTAQRLTLAASLILALTGAYIAWRYLSLTNLSNRIDEEIGQAQTEARPVSYPKPSWSATSR